MSRVSITILFLVLAVLLAPVKTAPTFLQVLPRQNSSSSFELRNALDAQQLNIKFSIMTANDTCNDGDQACITSAFARCVSGKWALTPCAAQTACFALPLVSKPGTSISCDSQADAEARFAAAGAQNGTGATAPSASGNSNPSDSTGGDNGDCGGGPVASSSTSSAASAAVTPPPSSISGSQLYKRQFSNITLFTVTLNTNTAASSTLSASSSSTATLNTASSVSPAASSISTTASNTFSDPVPIQTAIGTDGLLTVTVTATVSVGCGGPATAFPSPLPSSTVTVTTTTLLGTPSAPSPGLPAPSNTLPSGATVPVLTNTLASGSPTLSPSTVSTVLPLSSSTSSVTPAASGFSFSTGAPVPTTIAPGSNNGAVNNGNGVSSSFDLSQLLTATVGS